jgi:hypothetical protein
VRGLINGVKIKDMITEKTNVTEKIDSDRKKL